MTTTNKPVCKLTGIDGNVFNIIGTVGRTLKKAGQKEQAEKFYAEVDKAESYDAVLQLAFEYVDVR